MMKNTLRLPALLLLTLALLATRVRADFHDHIGLQLYSLRANTLAHGLPSSLDLIKGWGITEIEGALTTAGMTPEQVHAETKRRLTQRLRSIIAASFCPGVMQWAGL